MSKHMSKQKIKRPTTRFFVEDYLQAAQDFINAWEVPLLHQRCMRSTYCPNLWSLYKRVKWFKTLGRAVQSPINALALRMSHKKAIVRM